jgi:hypothetical protein
MPISERCNKRQTAQVELKLKNYTRGNASVAFKSLKIINGMANIVMRN